MPFVPGCEEVGYNSVVAAVMKRSISTNETPEQTSLSFCVAPQLLTSLSSNSLFSVDTDTKRKSVIA